MALELHTSFSSISFLCKCMRSSLQHYIVINIPSRAFVLTGLSPCLQERSSPCASQYKIKKFKQQILRDGHLNTNSVLLGMLELPKTNTLSLQLCGMENPHGASNATLNPPRDCTFCALQNLELISDTASWGKCSFPM